MKQNYSPFSRRIQGFGRILRNSLTPPFGKNFSETLTFLGEIDSIGMEYILL
jgi:hypothetical protein